eukprot:gene9926-12598_t
MALFLLMRMYNGRCRSLNQLDMYNCDSDMGSRALPQGFMMILMFFPLNYSCIYKSLRFEDIMATV